ncbi:MAG: hypothetical protein OEM59_08475 [Rhodospirillales bacterium]|nr:hypothetical protein [Rhodospirillales bacterium]
MSYAFIKWAVFFALLLTVPALFFLVQVVMFIPAIFFVAGMAYVTPKVFVPGHAGESLTFIAILGLHAVVYALVYYGIAILLAKSISMIRNDRFRALSLAIVCFGLVGLTFFSVYGGGGHGPVSWMPLPELAAEINLDYGDYTLQIVYGTTILLFCAVWYLRHHGRKHPRR